MSLFLFYKRKELIKGESTSCPYCGSNNCRVTSSVNYISFIVLPLTPLKVEPCYTCISCGRTTHGDERSLLMAPKVSKFRILNKFIGLPILLAAFGANAWYQNHQQELQQLYRNQPQAHDVMFVDNFRLTSDLGESHYPYRIAKIVDIDPDAKSATVSLSNVSYNNVSRAIRDFSSKGHLYNSFFLRKTIQVPIASLQNKQLVVSMERPFNPIDVEKLQSTIEFNKKYGEIPYYK